MMVYTVTEEHPLGIDLKILEILTGAVSLIILKDILKSLPHLKIILAVLHPDNVTAIFCRFSKMIYIFLLLEREIFPTGNTISHDLQIRKFINQILEFLLFLCAGH
jgi:hypothetical protein